VTASCDQSPDWHPEGTVYNHIKLMLAALPADAPSLLAWAAMLHDVAKPVTASSDPKTGAIHFYGHEKVGAEIAEALLSRLKFPRKQIEEVVTAVRHHMQFKDVKAMRKATLRQMVLRKTFPLEMALHRLDCLGSHRRLDHYDFMLEQAKELERRPEIRPPLLKGDDLKKLGIKAGPGMGKLLAEIREKQLQDELKTPAEARAWVKRQIKEGGSSS
jgi:putative nucleotidyltransferase with HDIG domain